MFPSKPEGGLAMYRSALVQNKHLAQLAKVRVNHRHAMEKATKLMEVYHDLELKLAKRYSMRNFLNW